MTTATWRLGRAAVISALSVVIILPCEAVTRHVPSQYPTIAAGLAAATAGDTVLIACGTYAEHGMNMRDGVTLRSASGDPTCVSIDGDSLGRVLLCSGVSASTRIEGLTIRGGFARSSGGAGMLCTGGEGPAISHCVFEHNTTYLGDGAGLNIVDCSPVVGDCTFQANEIIGNEQGGNASSWNSAPVFTNCRFLEGIAASGGGYYVRYGAPAFRSCQFRGNVVPLVGGGVYCLNGTPRFDDCIISQNRSEGPGGGMECESGCQVTINRTVFSSNVGASTFVVRDPGSSATVTDSQFESNSGSAGYVLASAIGDFTRCLFWGNQSARGAGLYYFESLPPGETPTGGSVVNCTFAYNHSDLGSAISSNNCGPVVEHCILAFQTGGPVVECLSSYLAFPVVSCSDSYGNEGGDWAGTCVWDQEGLRGNFSADPLFCDGAAGDFRLDAHSPCLTGQECGLVGAYGQGCAATSVSELPSVQESWGLLKGQFRR